jgi:chemotaxis protein MotB
MSIRKPKQQEKKGLDIWVMTYGDMMSLLLTFFILIVSFSTIQESKFNEAAMSLKGALGVMSQPPGVIAQKQPVVMQMGKKEREDILYEVQKLERLLLDRGLDKDVDIQVTDQEIAFRINAPLLFASGQATIRNEIGDILRELGAFLQKFAYPIRIEGHTDSLAIHTDRFPSNWELSAARAVAVARFFQDTGVDPERIAALGYGEFHPLASNETPEGRAANRRVEIFLRLDKERGESRELPLQNEENGDGRSE